MATIAELTSSLATARQRAADIGNELTAAVNRLPAVQREIAAAIASGDSAALATLRAERVALEQSIRDNEGALPIASQAVTVADRDLARAEVDALFADLVADVQAFATKVEELRQLAQRIRGKQRGHHSRFSVCDFSGAASHPMHWRQAFAHFGSVPAGVFASLEGYNQPITTG